MKFYKIAFWIILILFIGVALALWSSIEINKLERSIHEINISEHEMDIIIINDLIQEKYFSKSHLNKSLKNHYPESFRPDTNHTNILLNKNILIFQNDTLEEVKRRISKF